MKHDRIWSKEKDEVATRKGMGPDHSWGAWKKKKEAHQAKSKALHHLQSSKVKTKAGKLNILRMGNER